MLLLVVVQLQVPGTSPAPNLCLQLSVLSTLCPRALAEWVIAVVVAMKVAFVEVFTFLYRQRYREMLSSRGGLIRH